MSQPTPDEPEEQAGSGSERVRMFVSDRLILVGRDATMRQMAQRMVAEGVGALVVTEEDQVHGSFPNVTSFWPLLPGAISTPRLQATSTVVAW
jgi:hypothetical protein